MYLDFAPASAANTPHFIRIQSHVSSPQKKEVAARSFSLSAFAVLNFSICYRNDFMQYHFQRRRPIWINFLIQNQVKSNKQFIHTQKNRDLLATDVQVNREENISFGKQFFRHRKFCSILIRRENARSENPVILPQPSDKARAAASL